MSIFYIAKSMINLLVLIVLLTVANVVVSNPILNSTATVPKGVVHHVDSKTNQTVNAHGGEHTGSILGRIVGVRSDIESIKDSTDKLKPREGRGVPCGPSPPGVGEPCVVCFGETEKTITDKNGYQCPCPVCEPATFMAEKCQCTEDGKMKSGPTCEIPDVDVGYINVPNVCPKPYPCSECKGDMVHKPSSCSGADDTLCICPEGTYPTGAQSCTLLPLCSVDHERRLVQSIDSSYPSYECRPCSDDTYQPYNDSAELCQPKPTTTPPQDDKTTITPISPECPTPVCNCPTTPSLEDSTLQDLRTAAAGPIYTKCDLPTVLWIVIGVLIFIIGYGLGHVGIEAASLVVCRCAKSVWDLRKKLHGCLRCGTYKPASLEEPSQVMDNLSSHNQPVSQSDSPSTHPSRKITNSSGGRTTMTKRKKNRTL